MLHSAGLEYARRTFLPFPTAEQLASTPVEELRATGLTGQRANGITAIAKIAVEDRLPSEDDARTDPERTIALLKKLPSIGPWSAAAALLWGFGSDDAHVSGDVALLRAAKLAYDQPEMTLEDLDRIAEQWRPARAWAARVLWLHLLGPAPRSHVTPSSPPHSDK